MIKCCPPYPQANWKAFYEISTANWGFTAANPMWAMWLCWLCSLCWGAVQARIGNQFVPSWWSKNHCGLGKLTARFCARACWLVKNRGSKGFGCYWWGRVYRLHGLYQSLSSRCHRWRYQAYAWCDCIGMYRLWFVCPTLPSRLYWFTYSGRWVFTQSARAYSSQCLWGGHTCQAAFWTSQPAFGAIGNT